MRPLLGFASLLACASTILLLGSPTRSSAAVSLTNGGFETLGVQYNPALGGLSEPSGWLNLSGLAIQSCSALAASPPNSEWTSPPASVTGLRYLRLVSDADAPSFLGAIAQVLGAMVAGETYTIQADIYGGPGTGTNYGATASLVSNANAAPATVYASQHVGGVANGAFAGNAFSFFYTATAADDGKPLALLLKADATGASQASRGGLDNIRLTVTSIPEPTVALLGALSGMLWLRRRRD